MKNSRLPYYLLFIFSLFSVKAVTARQTLPPEKYSRAELKKQYDDFLPDLEYLEVAKDFPKSVTDLLSDDGQRQRSAMMTLGASGKPYVIPWLVPFLDSNKKDIRIWAGASISKVVEIWALQRRDPGIEDEVVLLPLKDTDLNIGPLRWIALKMFDRVDDGNTHAYAAVMTRYLEAKEFEDELLKSLKSKHPAVSNKAKWALDSLVLSR